MVSESTRCGLIVAPARRASDVLEELIAHVDWPVLRQPSVRTLLQQIEISLPHCLLFWLDDTHEITHALQLIARLRDRGPRPYRIAIAHQLRPEVEPTIRAAGIHSLLCTSGNMAALVRDALLPLIDLHPQPESALADHPASNYTRPRVRHPTHARASPAEMRPP